VDPIIIHAISSPAEQGLSDPCFSYDGAWV
jgi:hypothetical protein